MKLQPRNKKIFYIVLSITLVYFILFSLYLITRQSEIRNWGGLPAYIYQWKIPQFLILLFLLVMTYIAGYFYAVSTLKSRCKPLFWVRTCNLFVILFVCIYIAISIVSGYLFAPSLYQPPYNHEGSYPDSPGSEYRYEASFPIFVHYFVGGKIYYTYSDGKYIPGTDIELCGSWDIGVELTYHLENNQIVVDRKYEHP